MTCIFTHECLFFLLSAHVSEPPGRPRMQQEGGRGGGSTGGSTSSQDWDDHVEEPELEFDDMGMELAAQDGKIGAHRVGCNHSPTCWSST